MARPRNTERNEPIRDRILAAATALFAAHGYHGASLSAIASSAGIRAPSLLYHFGSKAQLYDDVVAAFYDELTASWTDSDGQPRDLIAALGSLRTLDQRRRELLVTIVTELLRDGRAAEVIERAVVPWVDDLVRGLDALAGGAGRRPTRQIVTLLIIAYVMDLDAGGAMPAVERLRRALWGDGDCLDDLARRLLRPDDSG